MEYLCVRAFSRHIKAVGFGEAGRGDHAPQPLPDLDRSVTYLTRRDRLYPPKYYLPPTPDFHIFLRPCHSFYVKNCLFVTWRQTPAIAWSFLKGRVVGGKKAGRTHGPFNVIREIIVYICPWDAAWKAIVVHAIYLKQLFFID